MPTKPTFHVRDLIKGDQKMNNNNSISCIGLTKTYRNFKAVDSLTMDVNQGDIFGFLGPNGAGKTTTIRMLCGLLSPSAGHAKVAGLDIIKDSTTIRKIIGLLPESSGFYNWMNAEEYLLHFAALYKIERSTAMRRTRELLESVGLADRSSAPIGYYSRGMKQRLGLARSLINEPRIIFLDEPTLGLDPKGQQDIQKILLELNHEKEVTIFLSSHALGDVYSLCNRMAIVDHGELVAQGSIEELRKLAGGSNGIVVSILNSEELEKKLSNLHYRFEINAGKNNKIIDVFIFEGISESINEILDAIKNIDLQIYEVRRSEMSLEDVFFKLTGTKKYSQENTSSNNYKLELEQSSEYN
jgi:ABC-2 type transport system ATP-binding protein